MALRSAATSSSIPIERPAKNAAFGRWRPTSCPGAPFQNLEDLNRQALAWSTMRLDNKPQGKAGLIPAKAFEHERTYLTAVAAPICPPPIEVHGRGTDEYGFMTLWRQLLLGARHPARRGQGAGIQRPAENLPGRPVPGRVSAAGRWREEPAKFSPPGQPAPPHQPHNRQHPTEPEEKHLRALAPAVGAYLDFALPTKGLPRHQFLRRLLALSRQMSVELFDPEPGTRPQISHHRPGNPRTIAWFYLQQGPGQLPLAASR